MTPTIRAPLSSARRGLVGVVHFDERVDARTESASSMNEASSIVAEGGDDQEDGARARLGRVEDFVLTDDEVLAQDWQRPPSVRTSARSSNEPSKNSRSVSTETALAPASR